MLLLPRKFITAIVFLSALTACGPENTNIRTSGANNLERALSASQNGQSELAAEFYLRAARENRNERVNYSLQAIHYFLVAGNFQQAIDVLNSFNYSNINSEQQLQADLLWARLSLAQGAASDALALLTIPDVQMSDTYWQQVWEVRGRSLLALDDPIEAVVDLAKSAELASKQNQQDLDQLIFQTLKYRPDDELNQFKNHRSTPHRLKGWVNLLLLFRNNLSGNLPVLTGSEQWQDHYPSLYLNREIAHQFEYDYKNRIQNVERIAVLLPLNTRYHSAAQAVLDGILNTHFKLGSQPEISVYPTSDDPQQAITAYLKAVEGGAQWVIGPLLKENVQAVLSQDRLPAPILSLNLAKDSEHHTNSYFFPLNPEADAVNMAHFMRKQGHQKVLLIASTDDWGKRISNSFDAAFNHEKGHVAQTVYYKPGSVDFGRQLKGLLQLGKSDSRHKRIEGLLRQKVGFELQRRDDIDAVFIASKSKEAHLLIPQIRFHQGTGLKLYSTPQIYSGYPDPQYDRDIEGVTFCDAPWLLGKTMFGETQKQVTEIYPHIANSQSRLFALGSDSLGLVPLLGWLREHPDEYVPAATGSLTVDKSGVVNRTLDCATFTKGSPRAIKNSFKHSPKRLSSL